MFNGLKLAFSNINKPTLVYAILSILPVVGFAPQLPTMLVYLSVVIYMAFCIRWAKGIDVLMLALLIYIPIELLLARPSSVFRPWGRYVLFAILLMNVSPLLQSMTLREYRKQIFQCVMWGCVFLGVGSFFAYFLGINYMKVGDGDYLIRASLFGGLTTHSMMLGPIAGIATCYLTNRAVLSGKVKRWIWIICPLLSVLLSASRSAILATIVGVSVTACYSARNVSKFTKYAIISLLLITITFPLWETALLGVLEKNGSTTELNYDSRTELWDDRVEEFLSSPIVGVGFCSINPNVSYGVDTTSGRVETGSSWLIIFSMLGLMGAVIVFLILIRAFFLARRREDDLKAVLMGVLSLFFVHMIAEGYIFAGGSFLALMFWLTVGVSTDSKFKDR